MIGVGNGVGGGGHVIAVLTDGTRTLINGHVCVVMSVHGHADTRSGTREYAQNPNVR